MMEVHATLEIVVTTTGVGGDGHPHIYFSGKDLYWGKLGDYYWKPGMSDTEVNKRVTAARRAVQKLMDEYKGHLTALCDGILKHIRQGQDVCGNSYAP
ncbi:hypothetical protein OV079_52080 [Nannocystis pusilla]|uniref:Uncharacterized protein n=1 Tax=Nannocystis pusilla TaxID=889268 RepID=A0A9X3J3M1_9BACT|nr:hypothetical protein [Nannocystis pusilla]MCY1013931.1 hypothetical protein [Nannocystis pusilla]